MSRLHEARPAGRAALWVSFVAGLALSAGGGWTAAVAAADPSSDRVPYAAQQRGQEQDPDERAARGEIPETGDDGPVVGGATLLLTPANLVVEPGRRIRVTLSILGAADLRRLPLTLRFDPAVVGVVDVRLGSAWSDRQPPVLLHDSSRPGELVVGLGLLARDESGIRGSGELLDIELEALAPGSADLILERFAAIGAGAKPQPVSAVTASITVR